MKSLARIVMALLAAGLFAGVIAPGVTAETYDIGEKVSESETDHRNMKLVYFGSGSKLYVEPDFIDHIPLILDGDERTGLNYNFGADHETMFFELIFPGPVNVSSITVKPAFGGNASAYTLYINSDGVYSPWLAQDLTHEKTFHLNCTIIGIWFWLNSNGTNHYYLNDIIIEYTPSVTVEDLASRIENLNREIRRSNDDISNLTTQIDALERDLENLESDVEKLEEENEFDAMDLFLEVPFTGFLWILLIVALLSSTRRRKPESVPEPEEIPEPEEEYIPPPESHEPPPPEEEDVVKGRFCPNCKKYTESESPFCPHCKRSMI